MLAHMICKIGQGESANLGNSAIVDLNQVARSRVHLETLVESESGLNSLGG